MSVELCPPLDGPLTYDEAVAIINQQKEEITRLRDEVAIGKNLYQRAVENQNSRIAELSALRARVAELESGGDVIKQRDKLLVMLEEIASYLNQTYSDLIGNNGAEWLAARYADDLLPKIKSTISSIKEN